MNVGSRARSDDVILDESIRCALVECWGRDGLSVYDNHYSRCRERDTLADRQAAARAHAELRKYFRNKIGARRRPLSLPTPNIVCDSMP